MKVPGSGPELRKLREVAQVKRSAIARAMGTGYQRIVNLEGQAIVSSAAVDRYLAALQAALGHVQGET